MIYEVIEDFVRLAVIVAGLYFLLGMYVRHRQPAWSGAVGRRRFAILFALALVVAAVEVAEDALGGESGPIDEAILVFIHRSVPSSLDGFFGAVTISGSSWTLVPLTLVGTTGFLLAGRRFEAVLIATSAIAGAIVVYAVKMATGRARPALWATEWYWGSSFPSGHTLVVAAIATAGVLCVSRIRPAARGAALSLAFVWILLVALSRMVLGVHWPTDVLAAAFIGAFLPLAISVALEGLAPRRVR